MSEAPAKQPSPPQPLLQRQNARDSGEEFAAPAAVAAAAAGNDSAFAEVSVADEFEDTQEERSEAVRLLPVAGAPLRLLPADHRRNHSVGEREERGRKEADAYRKCSEGNQMADAPSNRKSLSEARGVQLGKIELVQSTEMIGAHRSYTAPCDLEEASRRRHYEAATMTNTPLGYSMSESMPPMSANEQSTVHITVQFSYPYVSLPPPYQMSEAAPAPFFVPLVLPVQGGKLANAEFLLLEVAKEFEVDEHYAAETLAVWMISDLLEVQLKPHHSPYEVGCCWAGLLKKFTSAAPEDAAEDKPLVMIKRRVQLSVRREQEILACCPRIREILFNDAYEAFMSGRYALPAEESAELAGLAMSAAFEPFNKEKHTVELLRQEMESFVPRHLVSTIKGPLVFGRALNGPNSLEASLLKAWRTAPHSLADVHSAFLARLHDKPYYGAAFFPGSIERPKKKWSLSGGASDINVLVGINETFVSVLDEAKKEILLVERIKDCTWNRIDPKSCEEAAEPSLLLTFPDDRRDKVNVLQIFGRQAVMINALLLAMASQAAEEEEALLEEDSGAELSDGGAYDYSNGGYSSSVPSTSRSLPLSTASRNGGGPRSGGAESGGAGSYSTSPPKTASSSYSAAGHISSCSPPSSTVSRVPSLTRHKKLCLATFNQEGVCLQAQGSLKVVFKDGVTVA